METTLVRTTVFGLLRACTTPITLPSLEPLRTVAADNPGYNKIVEALLQGLPSPVPEQTRKPVMEVIVSMAAQARRSNTIVVTPDVAGAIIEIKKRWPYAFPITAANFSVVGGDEVHMQIDEISRLVLEVASRGEESAHCPSIEHIELVKRNVYPISDGGDGAGKKNTSSGSKSSSTSSM